MCASIYFIFQLIINNDIYLFDIIIIKKNNTLKQGNGYYLTNE